MLLGTSDRHRTAFTIIEVTAAAAILAAILGAIVPMLLVVQAQRREIAAHRQALRIADNLLERVLAVPAVELRTDNAGDTIGANELLDELPGSSWQLSIAEESPAMPVRRVTVTVSYAVRGQATSVRLAAWKLDRGRNPTGEDG